MGSSFEARTFADATPNREAAARVGLSVKEKGGGIVLAETKSRLEVTSVFTQFGFISAGNMRILVGERGGRWYTLTKEGLFFRESTTSFVALKVGKQSGMTIGGVAPDAVWGDTGEGNGFNHLASFFLPVFLAPSNYDFPPEVADHGSSINA